jgi:serine/threonine protein kinase
VLNVSNVVRGFQIINPKVGTLQYSAPEVLVGFQNKVRISNVKTDIYSLGLVLLELFTRKPAWKQFNSQFVISGGLPDLGLKRFLDNFKDIKQEIGIRMMRIIIGCLEMDPEMRTSMENICQLFCQLENDCNCEN